MRGLNYPQPVVSGLLNFSARNTFFFFFVRQREGVGEKKGFGRRNCATKGGDKIFLKAELKIISRVNAERVSDLEEPSRWGSGGEGTRKKGAD